jgi:hypothetical protein
MTIVIQTKRPYGTYHYCPVIKDGNRILWEGGEYSCDESGRALATIEAEAMLESVNAKLETLRRLSRDQ